MDTDRSYEIFKKERDNTTVLVEAVKGLEEAEKRIRQLNESSRSNISSLTRQAAVSWSHRSRES
jgi:hypothetical protein